LCLARTPSIVILASRFDLSCDYVVAELRRKEIPYQRINTQDLPDLDIFFDPEAQRLVVRSGSSSFELNPATVSAIYFRRPVYLRSCPPDHESLAGQLSSTHWATFVCSLMLFDQCRWMNYPGAVYVSEHKAVQLSTAARIGFSVPTTRITNSMDGVEAALSGGEAVAVKGLDTVLFRSGDTETFGYTSIIGAEELSHHELRSAPFIAQQAITDTLDLRVTVVGDSCWCASVTHKGNAIDGDWRRLGRSAEFSEFQLPDVIQDLCISLTKQLGLTFGAIDLALQNDQYYFLEINPTGEWAWLHVGLGFPIPAAIVAHLASSEPSD